MTRRKDTQYDVTPGEPVGVIAAQSLGEPGTQMILKSFHMAGAISVIATSGLPRIVEIVDTKKKPATPFTYVYLDEKSKKNFEKAFEITKKINEVKLRNLVKRVIENFPNGTIKILLDKQVLDSNDLSAKSIASRIAKQVEVDATTESERVIKISTHTKKAKAVRDMAVKIMGLTVNGIEGAGSAVVQQDPKTQEFFVIASDSNIEAILEIDGIDKARTYTNDIFKMYHVLGIEAARNTIANELFKTFSEQGIHVSSRHLLLLADAMTSTGEIRNIGRHGLSGEKNSVFARAAYEETVKHLINAAAFGEVDEIRGVTESVLIGKQILLGTGTVQLAVKKDELAKIKKKEK